ncbi:uncharacterized protein LOC120144713 [Hibiscus syriacus]|uniref:uncharacterized protein LOC120144713 n=1 Tax=Hibiscus syriacus TaxID=106335 RepID=UPI001923381B|nr:uncharacterized protein LOC120144713 [Hibiscus syriacus]
MAKLYIFEILILYSVSLSIISDRNPRFTSRFSKALNEALGTHLNFSKTSHPQTDCQYERMVQFLEDMLQGYVIDFCSSWEDFWLLVEFSYNKNYQASIYMEPYEALCGVFPWNKVLRFRHKGKLSPSFIGLYRIQKRVGHVAYKLELPPQLSRIHDVFHVSMLRQYHPDSSHIIQIEDVDLRPDLSYEEEPVQILDQDKRVLRNRRIMMVKVQWSNRGLIAAM